MKKICLFAIGLSTAVSGIAQHAHQHKADGPHAHAHAQSPYAGMQNRAIKALSERQIADLRAGKGMSFALPAELNGYPGPAHVLELAGPLDLTADQELKTRRLFEQMQAEAKTLAEELISREAELDSLFRHGKANPESVREAAANAAHAQGMLRASHLRYHLQMMDVLTSTQVARYNALRGY